MLRYPVGITTLADLADAYEKNLTHGAALEIRVSLSSSFISLIVMLLPLGLVRLSYSHVLTVLL